jgi:NADH dehydrogenase [ubiquinone] 1 alpha subcomplex assembly factor 5
LFYRLDDINRNFPLALDIGCHRGQIYNCIKSRENLRGDGGAGGVRSIIQCDVSAAAINHIKKLQTQEPSELVKSMAMQCDDESLPFQQNSFDLVTSSMYLHWVNDLPGIFNKIKTVLKPDGVFIGCMLGGDTLHELKQCLYIAEQERRGGLSLHTSPYASASDVAGLMQSAGFSLPTIDIDTITVSVILRY